MGAEPRGDVGRSPPHIAACGGVCARCPRGTEDICGGGAASAGAASGDVLQAFRRVRRGGRQLGDAQRPDTFNATIGGRDLWETYLPAFKACTVEAGATHVMCSYNQLNGVPTCATPGLLTEILRMQWKWDGFVVSDYDGTISVTMCVCVSANSGWVNVWVWVVGGEAVGLRC